jgi:hypothetical protein
VLQNSLGGNSFTTLLATIHPSASHYEECLSTLQFANRCRNVQNNPRINYVDAEDKDAKIKRLVDENQSIRSKLAMYATGASGAIPGVLGGAGGTGGSRGSRGGPLDASSVKRLLRQLGMRAEVDANGQLVVNGQVVSLEGSGGSEAESDFDEEKMGAASDSVGGRSLFSLSRQDLIKELKALRETSKEQKEKLSTQREHAAVARRDIAAMTKEVASLRTINKQQEFKVVEAFKSKDYEVANSEEVLRTHYEAQLSMLHRDQKLALGQTQKLAEDIPNGLRDYDGLVAKLKKKKQDVETPLRRMYEQELEAIQASHETNMHNIIEQYGHWIRTKDAQLADFVFKFNEYRAKKSRNLKACEEELCRLFKHGCKLEGIVDRAQAGGYPVCQLQGREGRPTTGAALQGATRPTTSGSSSSSSRSRGVSKERPQSAAHATKTHEAGASSSSSSSYGINDSYGRVVLPVGFRPESLRSLLDSHDPSFFPLARKIVKRYKLKSERDQAVLEQLDALERHEKECSSTNRQEAPPTSHALAAQVALEKAMRHSIAAFLRTTKHEAKANQRATLVSVFVFLPPPLLAPLVKTVTY